MGLGFCLNRLLEVMGRGKSVQCFSPVGGLAELLFCLHGDLHGDSEPAAQGGCYGAISHCGHTLLFYQPCRIAFLRVS